MKFTHSLPTTEGFYWWTNFGEHTPTILRVKKSYSDGKLYASDGEFHFEVAKAEFEKDPEMMVDGHYYGEEMWCGPITIPTVDGKEVQIDCY